MKAAVWLPLVFDCSSQEDMFVEVSPAKTCLQRIVRSAVTSILLAVGLEEARTDNF